MPFICGFPSTGWTFLANTTLTEHRYVESTPPNHRQSAHAAALSICLSPGFLIVDHIHFQYNGFLYGLLLLSIVLARQQSTMLYSGIAFATLLCFKHIYLYLAPAFFVHLLRVYCLDVRSTFRPRFQNIFKLGISVIGVAGLASGPFFWWGQIEQLRHRLFPFSRGLCHAYWAPNVWALYSFLDRFLLSTFPAIGGKVNEAALQSTTRGLVGDTAFAVLPDITEMHCFVLTLIFQLPALIKLWAHPTWERFVAAITLCGYASFLFGWHVHEKAVLLTLIPFTLLALKDRRYLSAFRPLAVAGHLSLFPLLNTPVEFIVQLLYTTFWLILFLLLFDRLAPASDSVGVFLLDRFSSLYIAGSIPMVVYCFWLHRYIFHDALAFLPLMLVSIYCTIGIVSSWLGMMVGFFTF